MKLIKYSGNLVALKADVVMRSPDTAISNTNFKIFR